jgi:hypothetical protein
VNNIKAILSVMAVLFLTLFIFGCVDNSIVEKMSRGQALSAEEQVTYNRDTKDSNIKKAYEKRIQKRKNQLIYENYLLPTEAEVKTGARKYMTHKGEEHIIDITPAACQKVGFSPGSRVRIPDRGGAYVVGVDKDGDMWFHVDGTEGAEYWVGYDKDKFIQKGFTPIEDSCHGAECAFKETVRKEGSENMPQKLADENVVKNVPQKSADSLAEVAHDDASNSKKLKKLQPIQPVPSLVEE